MRHHDTEQMIERALDRRAGDLGAPTGRMADVVRRVDARRRNRRSVAVVGSLAVIGVGGLGLAALESGDPGRELAGLSDAPDNTTPASGSVSGQAMWRCTDPLPAPEVQSASSVADGHFFAKCGLVDLDENGHVVGSVPAAAPPTAPPTTVHDTTVGPNTTTTTIVFSAIEQTYSVASSDTLAWIAEFFGTTVDQLVAYNDLDDADVPLQVGQFISIPPGALARPGSVHTIPPDLPPVATAPDGAAYGEQRHVVEVGDTMASIAERFGVTLDQLVNYNEFPEGANHLILPGETILVPPGARSHPDHVLLGTVPPTSPAATTTSP